MAEKVTLSRVSVRIIAALGMLGLAPIAPAQDMLQHADVGSPEMASAEMSRADVEAAITAATPAQPVDLAGKKLSGLDLSGLDLSGAVLRAAGSLAGITRRLTSWDLKRGFQA